MCIDNTDAVFLFRWLITTQICCKCEHYVNDGEGVAPIWLTSVLKHRVKRQLVRLRMSLKTILKRFL